MIISEPTTMLTDYALAALCVWAAWRLVRASTERAVLLWVAAFGVTAVAALAGGTAHGFREPLGTWWEAVWSVTVGAIALGSVLLIGAAVRSVLRPCASSDVTRGAGLSFMKRALAVTLLALAVLVGRLSLHEHFNQNDLYHVLQMVGLYFLYRGAVLLHGLESRA